ncbi:MAG: glycosyltransferase family 39 protein [Cyanobacteria bacterium P01_D01_bin.1]
MPSTRRDLLILLAWTSLLLASSQIHPSFMAHDEGNYALESRFMLESGEWLGRQIWGNVLYTHGILLNWLIILSYQIFDLPNLSADWAVRVARLPTFIACLLAVTLTYDIGKQICARQQWPYAKAASQIGLLSGLLIMVFSLWMQFSHMATQDIMLVSVELLAIWALLKAEVQKGDRQRLAFGFLAGAMLGIGFLIKTFMVALSAIALLPYLIFEHRRHRHLTNWGIYLGLVAGFVPTILWMAFSLAKYGPWVLDSMFGKIGELSGQPYHSDGGPLYYLWNIPANMFPWALFSVIGAGIVVRSPGFWTKLFSLKPQSAYPHRWLLLYPFLLAGMLQSFTTKTPYYTLQLHPFLALFAAIALYKIATQSIRWPRRLLSYSFSALGLIVVGVAIAALLTPVSLLLDIQPYAPFGLVLGLGWALLPIFMPRPHQWLATWLVPLWLTFSTAGVAGFLGNYSAEMKAAVTTDPVAPLISDAPVDFVINPGQPPALYKDLIILAFHTSHIGQLNRSLEEIPSGTYVWLSKEQKIYRGEQLTRDPTVIPDTQSALLTDLLAAPPHPTSSYKTVLELKNWRLIQL